MQVGGQRVYVLFGEDEPRVSDDVGNFAAGGSDDGDLAGHGFDEHASELLLPVGTCARGEDEDVEGVVDAGHLRARHPRRPANAFGNAQMSGQSLQPSLLPARAHDVRLPLPRQPDQGPQEHIDALFGDESPRVPHGEGAPGGAPFGVGAEELGVHAELGENADGPFIPLASQHAQGLLISRDGKARVFVDVAFEGGEGDGIFAVDVLPGEEQGRDAEMGAVAEGQPCGQVVRFLIHVEHIGAQSAQLAAQRRVEVEVVGSGQADRDHPQLISPHMNPFQPLQPPFIPPIGGHENGQFDVRVRGDLLQFALIRAHNTGLG